MKGWRLVTRQVVLVAMPERGRQGPPRMARTVNESTYKMARDNGDGTWDVWIPDEAKP